MSDFLMAMIERAIQQVMDRKSKRVDQYIEDEVFDKITVYRCGNNVIRIDLHSDFWVK